jgi:L-ascorbate metabolism protein UlaG (beta-lactamase superfamily)
LGPEQAVQAALDVRARLFIPMHWGTFKLAVHGWTEPAERLLVAAQAAGLPLAIPRPGESLEPSALAPLTRWWPEAVWEGADAAPVKSTGL